MTKTNYTNNKLRERIKNQIKSENVGGTSSGKWSARKSQLLAQRYKKAGGGYKKNSSKTDSQKSLTKWTKQKWTTADGGNSYRKNSKGKKIAKKYLPEKAWNNLSKDEVYKLNQSKSKAFKKKKQFSNSPKKLRKKINKYWK